MILLPAIDLLDGQCVRLRRGDFDTAHRVAADPLETARSFEQAGAAWIHMVDLDGARTGSAQNQEIILRIARETSLLVEAVKRQETLFRSCDSWDRFGPSIIPSLEMSVKTIQPDPARSIFSARDR